VSETTADILAVGEPNCPYLKESGALRCLMQSVGIRHPYEEAHAPGGGQWPARQV